MDKLFYPCDPKLVMITDTWRDHADRPGYGGWNGYDIASYGGDKIPLYSVIQGICVESAVGGLDNKREGLGNYVIIENETYRVLFGHMDALSDLRVGDITDAGQQIGVMGKTGSATGTHVHWTMWGKTIAGWGVFDPGMALMVFYNPVMPEQTITLSSNGSVVFSGITEPDLLVGSIHAITDTEIGLSMRAQPATTSQRLGILYDGQEVEVIEDLGAWLKVKYTKEFYIYNDYVK